MASNQLSKNIARCRKQIGMTQEDLGQALFISGQAVSRWERGGTPDAELLPKIADALGVSLDVLFGREADRESDAETALSRELARTPAAKRVERAEQLAWHMMKIVASSGGGPGKSYFRAMTANENMDRRSAEEPQQIPVNNYFDFDAGIMQACVARDFHYALLMPEPEQGYASIMKNSAAYQKFFAFLAQEHYLDMLVLAYCVPGERNFTADFASRQLGIDESEAGRILDHMYQTRMLQRSEIRLADRILYAYARHDETLIVPFLYFAARGTDLQSPARNRFVLAGLVRRHHTEGTGPSFRRRLRRRLRDKLLFHGLLLSIRANAPEGYLSPPARLEF